jgi:Bax protein
VKSRLAGRSRVNAWFKILVIVVVLLGLITPLWAQEVIVLSGLDETIAWLKAENWWGEEKRDEQLTVPHAMIVAISERWQKNAPKLPVATKKEIFYRFMLPLVMHANTMVLDRRERLQRLKTTVVGGSALSAEDDVWLREIAVILRIANREKISQMTDSAELRQIIDQALYKLDVIPAGLVLGQAAYESGYGTSRFAVKGNALFGQWTFGGEGLVPEQQRKQLGDHRIASFEWPFDSVRGYFINLSSHPAYEDFRRLRAKLKAAGKPMSSIALAEGLKNYSERGQAYVDTLRSIIRVNRLNIADNAVFRDEPMRFALGATDQAAAAKLRTDIKAMRKSGELAQIIERMRLE